jgi:peptidyl-tRNA hydrolase
MIDDAGGLARHEELRVYILVRTDIAVPRLALASLSARATWAALRMAARTAPERLSAYDDAAQPKIALRVKSEGHLARALVEARAAGLPAELVHSSEGIPAALGIGPVLRTELPGFVAKQQLLSDEPPPGAGVDGILLPGGLAVWLLARDIVPYGKLAAQAGHGLWSSVSGLLRSGDPLVDEWEDAGTAVNTLAVQDLSALEEVYRDARRQGLPASFIVDEGRTVFKGPTPTVVGIGPCLLVSLPESAMRLSGRETQAMRPR